MRMYTRALALALMLTLGLAVSVSAGEGRVIAAGDGNLSFDRALTAALEAGEPVTIKLGQDVVRTAPIHIVGGQDITIDLGGNTLEIVVSDVTDNALFVNNASSLTVTGGGLFSVVASNLGQFGSAVLVHNESSLMVDGASRFDVVAADVTNALDVSGGSMVYVSEESLMSVSNVRQDGAPFGIDSTRGIRALQSAVTIRGDVSVSGVYALGIRSRNGTVTVYGNITAQGQDSAGVYISNPAGRPHLVENNSITVHGNVTATSPNRRVIVQVADHPWAELTVGTPSISIDDHTYRVMRTRTGSVVRRAPAR